jgi:hypothetical protein
VAPSRRKDPGGATSDRPTAITAREQRAQLVAALFRHYDSDEDFKEQLVALIPLAEAAIKAHGPVPGRTRIDLTRLADAGPDATDRDVPEVANFLVAARDLASASGLERLGDDGLRHVLAWCDRYISARGSRLSPRAYGPGTLSTVRAEYTFEPEVFGIVPAPWRREEWSPTHESRGDARLRLEAKAKRAIQRALDEIEKETEERRLLRHPRPVPNLERDIKWLYRKLRGDSYELIYQRWPTPPVTSSPDTVRKAVERIARKLGVDTSGWESGWV